MLWQLEWTDMNDIGTPFMQAVNCMNYDELCVIMRACERGCRFYLPDGHSFAYLLS